MATEAYNKFGLIPRVRLCSLTVTLLDSTDTTNTNIFFINPMAFICDISQQYNESKYISISLLAFKFGIS